MKNTKVVYDALVIGGGINGLAACYHLALRGLKHLCLIERFRLGNERGSSHGRSRITRSAYIEEHYVRLMQIAHNEEWPRLEREGGVKLIYPTPGCFFGPARGAYSRYERAVVAAGAEVEPLTPAEGRARFPMFRFSADMGILHDRTAGVIAAAEALQSLALLLRRHEVDLHEQTEVLEIDRTGSLLKIRTSRGSFEAERLVISAGPWTSRLVPELAAHLSVARQTVGYFSLAAPQDKLRAGVFPIWAYLSERSDIGYYGLPEFEREGVKIARHITVGAADDPDEIPSQPPPRELDGLRLFLETNLVPGVEQLTGWESCLYTNTADEGFIIDHHPADPRIVIGAGFSGHGFKLAPLTGRLLAELLLDGHSALPELESARRHFSLTRFSGRDSAEA